MGLLDHAENTAAWAICKRGHRSSLSPDNFDTQVFFFKCYSYSYLLFITNEPTLKILTDS